MNIIGTGDNSPKWKSESAFLIRFTPLSIRAHSRVPLLGQIEFEWKYEQNQQCFFLVLHNR